MFRNKIIVFVLAGLMTSLMAASAHAEGRVHRFNLTQGKTRSATPDYQLKTWHVTVNGEAVEAWYDSENSRFHVKGVKPGRAVVTFTGTYRKIIVGKELREVQVPFRDTIYVTVVPAKRR